MRNSSGLTRVQRERAKIKKTVITAGGLGTRLLPMSKELPKEMLPIYARNTTGNLILKPILQALFEQIYQLGTREFCLVVGRDKRAGKRAVADLKTDSKGEGRARD